MEATQVKESVGVDNAGWDLEATQLCGGYKEATRHLLEYFRMPQDLQSNRVRVRDTYEK